MLRRKLKSEKWDKSESSWKDVETLNRTTKEVFVDKVIIKQKPEKVSELTI